MTVLAKKASALRNIAIVGIALFMLTPPASAVQITFDLANDCSMPAPTFTVCEAGGQTIPGGDPLWIDFTLGGAPMAHIVSEATTTWLIQFFFSNVSPIPTDPPLLDLTDMGGVIPGLEGIAGFVITGPTRYNYDPVVPGGTFIHDLHLEEVCESCQLDKIQILTFEPHVKGLWVPEPASVLLVGAGLFGAGVARRKRG